MSSISERAARFVEKYRVALAFALLVVTIVALLALLASIRLSSSSSAQPFAPTILPSVTPIPSTYGASGFGTTTSAPTPTGPADTPPAATPTPALAASLVAATGTPAPDQSAEECSGRAGGPGLPPFSSAALEGTLDPVGYFGVVIYDDPLGQEIYTCHAAHRFYAASLIKLPVAVTLLKAADRGELSLDEELTTTAGDMVGGTGSIQGDPVGTSYTLRELARRMIAESDNVAANLLLGRLTFARINSQMTELGANETRVERLFFDDAARLAGKDITTSPRDMALLLRGLLHQGLLSPGSTQFLLDAMGRTIDDTKIPALLPPEVMVRNKTGAVEGIEHDAGIVELPGGRRYVVVLMGEELTGNGAAVEAIAQASRLIYDYEAALP